MVCRRDKHEQVYAIGMAMGTIDEVETAVTSLVVAADRDSVAHVLAVLDRLQARVVAAVGELDAAGGWALDGAGSLPAWLRDRGRMGSAALQRRGRSDARWGRASGGHRRRNRLAGVPRRRLAVYRFLISRTKIQISQRPPVTTHMKISKTKLEQPYLS